MLDSLNFNPVKRIRDKIITAFVAVSLIPLLILVYFVSSEFDSDAQEVYAVKTDTEIKALDRDITNFISDMKADVSLLAENPLFKRVDGSLTTYYGKKDDSNGTIKQLPLENSELEATIFKTLEFFRAAYPKVEYLSFAAKNNGGYVQSPATTRKAGYDPRQRPWYELAKQNPNEVMVTDPYATSNGAAYEISFVKAVHDDKGNFTGVLSVDVTLQGLTKRFKSFYEGNTGFIIITDSHGNIIIDSRNNAKGIRNINEFGITKLNNNSNVSNDAFNAVFNNINFYIHVYTSPTTGWKIIAFTDSMAVSKAVKRSRESIVVFGLLIFIMALALGIYLAKTIDRPVKQLVKAAEAIAAGDLAAPRKMNIGSTSKDEIGLLGDSITVMADKIADAFHEIEENTRREVVAKALSRQNEYLALLHKTSLGLMNQLNPDTVLNMIVSNAAELLGTMHGFIYQLNKDKTVFTMTHGVGVFSKNIGYRTPVDKGVVGSVYNSGRPFVIHDYSQWHGRLNASAFQQLKAVVQVPLKNESRVFGTIGVSHFDDRKLFGQEEVELLTRFAQLASIALENARLHNELQKELGNRLKAEAALLKSEINNRALLSAIPDTIFRFDSKGVLYDLREGKDKIPWISYDGGIDNVLTNVIPVQLAEKIQGYSLLTAKFNDIRSFEYDYNSDDQTEWEIRIVNSGHDEFLAIIRDVTERRAMQRRLEYMSMHDALTSLYNRNRFEQEMLRLDGFGFVGVVICDVDGLKFINDSLGHEAGDKLLTETGNLLKKVFGENEVLARVGGDEFAILLTNTSQYDIDKVCDKLRASIQEYNLNNQGLLLSVSVGAAFSNNESSNLNQLYKEADDRMYREKLQRKSGVHNTIAKALMNTLDARNYGSPGHTSNIQKLAVKIASKQGLDGNNIEQIKLLAKYHDIGTIGVSENILLKAGALNARERQEIYRHSEVGYRLAQSIPELVPIAEWIFKHHEWWNGSGYPLGLKGEEIPIECRIVTIADAYDAMINVRPYRNAMAKEQALKELEKSSGIQFDPQLIKLALQILSEDN